MATPRLGLVVEDKPTELSCVHSHVYNYHSNQGNCISYIMCTPPTH